MRAVSCELIVSLEWIVSSGYEDQDRDKAAKMPQNAVEEILETAQRIDLPLELGQQSASDSI